MAPFNPRLPKSRLGRPLKRSPDATPKPALNWLRDCGPLETGEAGDVFWAYRYRPGWEASYVAAWMPLDAASDPATFFDRTLAVGDLVGGPTLAPDAPLRPLASNNMAREYIPQLKTALDLTFATPSHAFIVEDEWNSFDIVFTDDTHWWRLSWGTSA